MQAQLGNSHPESMTGESTRSHTGTECQEVQSKSWVNNVRMTHSRLQVLTSFLLIRDLCILAQLHSGLQELAELSRPCFSGLLLYLHSRHGVTSVSAPYVPFPQCGNASSSRVTIPTSEQHIARLSLRTKPRISFFCNHF